ncbi:hypothetical protein Glove_421g71 [Diversispora epigaea]|uniref:Protein kinase domain-containing protein n=1 Tax=Diversispora epigaea TaxID=1348612 RepID=A0A397H010_9GLOM|nr:hypothetical protein Glove_421g71 [Diversispora epigaea]
MDLNRLAALICFPSFFKRSKNINTKIEKDILTSVSENVEFDFSLPTTPQEIKQRKKRYGVCLNCGYPLSDKSWCQSCEGQKLQQRFNNWSSGNQFVDNFIQSSQLKPLNQNAYLSWIPYDDLIQVRYMANGGFSAVYSALWDHFETGQVVDVVLKRLHNGRTSDPEFLREQIAMFIYAASRKSSVIRCYGMTLHPTEGYMLVMERGEEGDLRSYLRENHSALLWSDKVHMIRDIAKSLEVLHSREFVHGDLHTGNILKKLPKDSSSSTINRLRKFIRKGSPNYRERECILDLSLCYNNNNLEIEELYGVMPYVAPEVFNTGYYTKASDVYSFGLVMWEIAVGQTPFNDYNFDENLVSDICKDVRPPIDRRSIPQFYADLIRRCWDPEPSNRPSARIIREIIDGWVLSTTNPKAKLENESKEIKTELKKCNTISKKRYQNYIRQSKMTDIASNTLTNTTEVFTSQNLSPYITVDEKSLSSTMKNSSSISSNSYQHYY